MQIFALALWGEAYVKTYKDHIYSKECSLITSGLNGRQKKS